MPIWQFIVLGAVIGLVPLLVLLFQPISQETLDGWEKQRRLREIQNPSDPTVKARKGAAGSEALRIARYDDFLRSAYWREWIRPAVLFRDDYRCVRCSSPDGLQVHHLRYPKTHALVKLEDLITLCRACHEAEHTPDPFPTFKW